MDVNLEHLFFHSFPRRKGDELFETQVARGLLISRNLLHNGLLLTPENYKIPILSNEGQVVDELQAIQRRICFTEITPSELPTHSLTFGPFALAYEIEDLRSLGALPVFYVPLKINRDDLSGLGVELLGGITDASRLIAILLAARTQLAKSPKLGLEYGGRSVNYSEDGSAAIRSFIDTLLDSSATDLESTHQKMSSVASCFYPTENLAYTGPLDYYRQREWRIVGASLTLNGEPIMQKATDDQIAELLKINKSFFEKSLEFYDPTQGVGAEVTDTIANRSFYFKQLGEIVVVGLAKYFIFPDEVELDADIVQGFQSMGVTVIGQTQFINGAVSDPKTTWHQTISK